jgi:hypothetical protein
MKLLYLLVVAIFNTFILCSPFHTSVSWYSPNPPTLQQGHRTGPAPNSTTTTILRELLKPQYRSDNLSNAVINRHLQLHEAQRNELTSLTNLLTRIVTTTQRRFDIILYRLREDLRPQVSQACYVFGRCSAREVTLYTLAYKHSVLADRCEQRMEAMEDVGECKKMQLKRRSQLSTNSDLPSPPYLRLMQSRNGSWKWQSVDFAIDIGASRRDVYPHKGHQVDPDDIARDIETEFNKMASVLIEVECPADLEDQDFEACIIGQEQPLERLRDRLPDSLDWSNDEEILPGVTAATTFGDCRVPSTPAVSNPPTPTTMPANHPPPITVTVTV